MYESGYAGVAQPVEHQLPKLRVASLNLVARSNDPDPGSGNVRLDLADQGLIRKVLDAGNHLLSLSAYLGGLPIIPDGRFDPVQSAQIRAAELFLADRGAWSDPDLFPPLTVPGLARLRVLAAPRPSLSLVVLEGETPVACIRTGLPLVSPDHRGRGLGALLVLISDLNGGRFLRPASYSEAGFRARRSAHALQVRIAQRATCGPAEKGTGAEAPVPSV